MSDAGSARLSVLIVNYNSWRLCVEALRSLRANPPTDPRGAPLPFEVIVVDNASPQRDPAAEAELEAMLASLHGELLRHHTNGGYGKGMNLALSRACGDMVLVCNPDIVFLPGCVDRLLRYLETHPDAGAVAPAGYWDEGLEARLPPNILPTLGDLCALFAAALSPAMVRRYSRARTRAALPVWTATRDVDLPMLSGCCFLIGRAVIDELGLFDERFPLYYEDTDLSMRLRRAGYRIVQVHGSKVVHLYNRSGQTDNELAMRRYYVSRRLYYRKWYGRPGAALYALTQRVLGTSWARRRAARCPQRKIDDLGAQSGPPVIEFDRDHERFLIEIALDPNFYLAAGVFGSGRRWTVGKALADSLGPTTFYFRALDLSGAEPRVIGVYRYTRLAPPAPDPANPADPADAADAADAAAAVEEEARFG